MADALGLITIYDFRWDALVSEDESLGIWVDDKCVEASIRTLAEGDPYTTSAPTGEYKLASAIVLGPDDRVAPQEGGTLMFGEVARRYVAERAALCSKGP